MELAELAWQLQQIRQQASDVMAERVPLDLIAIEQAIPGPRVRELFVRYLEETGGVAWTLNLRPSDYASGRAILNADPEPRLAFGLAALDGRDDWGYLALDALDELDDDTGARWLNLLRYAATANGSKPSGIWLKGARESLAGLTETTFVDLAVRWLGLLREPRRNVEPENLSYRNDDGFNVPSALLTERNGDILKGLA